MALSTVEVGRKETGEVHSETENQGVPVKKQILYNKVADLSPIHFRKLSATDGTFRRI